MADTKTNLQVLLSSLPKTDITNENFTIQPVAFPEVPEGGILVKTLYLTVDPYMRLYLKGGALTPWEVGKPCWGFGVGKIIESKTPKFSPNDLIYSNLSWQHYLTFAGENLDKVNKIQDDFALPEYLHALGMTGQTAWVGTELLGNLKAGQTALISTAAGAVGMIVGQIAKLKGCRVIGLVGSDEKAALLEKEFGFDKSINYKTPDLFHEIQRVIPERIDYFFDNVGGKILDAVFGLMKQGGLIVQCGSISSYNNSGQPDPIYNYFAITLLRLTVKGFTVYDHDEEWGKTGATLMKQWLKEGKIKTTKTWVEGIERLPEALQSLFLGTNIGKVIVKIADA